MVYLVMLELSCSIMSCYILSCYVMCRLWGTWCTPSCSEETSPARTRRTSCARCCTVLYCTVLYTLYCTLNCTGAGLGGRLGGGGQVLCRHRHHLHRRHCLPGHLLHSQVQIDTTQSPSLHSQPETSVNWCLFLSWSMKLIQTFFKGSFECSI